MFELLKNVQMSSAMVKALLSANGIDDPYVHELADVLVGGGFSHPEKIGVEEAKAAGLMDGDTAMYAVTNGKEVVTFLVTRRPVPEKKVDTGKSP